MKKMHPSFVKEFKSLKDGHINDLACATIQRGGRPIFCFELLIDGKRICWEFEPGFGRCFTMEKDDVDGAGVFPLSPSQVVDPDDDEAAKAF